MMSRDDLVPFLLTLPILSIEAYLEPCQTSLMEFLCENGERLKGTPLKYTTLIFSMKEKETESLSCMKNLTTISFYGQVENEKMI